MGAGQLYESGIERSAREKGNEYVDPYYLYGAADMGDGTYQQNRTDTDNTASSGIYGTSARNYYKGYLDHNSEAQLFDASYIKLREVKLGYFLPKSILGNLPVRDVFVSLVARNMALWTNNIHFDPETAMANTGGGMIPGFENLSLPSTKSYGFNINFKL